MLKQRQLERNEPYRMHRPWAATGARAAPSIAMQYYLHATVATL